MEKLIQPEFIQTNLTVKKITSVEMPGGRTIVIHWPHELCQSFPCDP